MFTHYLTVFYGTKDIRRGKEHCRTEQQQKDSITSYQPDPFPFPSLARRSVISEITSIRLLYMGRENHSLIKDTPFLSQSTQI